MATWGHGVPVRHSHDEYGLRIHRHPYTDIDGAPDPDYIVSDELEDRLRELEDRLRDFKEELDREVDDNFAEDRHVHDEIGELGSAVDDLADELRGALNELRGYSEALRDRVRDIERDNAAIIRRMRAFEAALRITPPAETLTSHDGGDGS